MRRNGFTSSKCLRTPSKMSPAPVAAWKLVRTAVGLWNRSVNKDLPIGRDLLDRVDSNAFGSKLQANALGEHVDGTLGDAIRHEVSILDKIGQMKQTSPLAFDHSPVWRTECWKCWRSRHWSSPSAALPIGWWAPPSERPAWACAPKCPPTWGRRCCRRRPRPHCWPECPVCRNGWWWCPRFVDSPRPWSRPPGWSTPCTWRARVHYTQPPRGWSTLGCARSPPPGHRTGQSTWQWPLLFPHWSRLQVPPCWWNLEETTWLDCFASSCALMIAVQVPEKNSIESTADDLRRWNFSKRTARTGARSMLLRLNPDCNGPWAPCPNDWQWTTLPTRRACKGWSPAFVGSPQADQNQRPIFPQKSCFRQPATIQQPAQMIWNGTTAKSKCYLDDDDGQTWLLCTRFLPHIDMENNFGCNFVVLLDRTRRFGCLPKDDWCSFTNMVWFAHSVKQLNCPVLALFPLSPKGSLRERHQRTVPNNLDHQVKVWCGATWQPQRWPWTRSNQQSTSGSILSFVCLLLTRTELCERRETTYTYITNRSKLSVTLWRSFKALVQPELFSVSEKRFWDLTTSKHHWNARLHAHEQTLEKPVPSNFLSVSVALS